MEIYFSKNLFEETNQWGYFHDATFASTAAQCFSLISKRRKYIYKEESINNIIYFVNETYFLLTSTGIFSLQELGIERELQQIYLL